MVPSGAKARARANIDAIRLVNTLNTEHRAATAAEQRVLAGYSSWGAVPQIFEDREDWAELAAELRTVLDDEQYHVARLSTLNAHYTDPGIVAAMWEQLQSAGFDEGTVLEPGCGSGNFMAQGPESARMVGIEIDPMTAQVASYLHPSATVRIEGFEKTRLPEAGITAAIGNVPFGAFSPFDLADNSENLAIHNYFIHKTMKHLAPGGYGAFVTSSWTMGAKSRTSRDVIADHSDLVAGVRLPAGAFSRVAGTEAQTDILVFRRRDPEVPRNVEVTESWVGAASESGEISGEPVTVATSKFFQEHPEYVMGTPELKLTGYPARPGLVVTGETGPVLNEQVRAGLSAQIGTAAARGLGYDPAVDASVSLETLAPGGLVGPGEQPGFAGEVLISETGRLVQRGADFGLHEVPLGRGVSRDEAESLVRIKTRLRSMIDAAANGEDVEQARQELEGLYDRYVETYGPINRFAIKAGARPSERTINGRVEKMRKRWAASFEDLTRAERDGLEPDEETEAEWREAASAPAADTKVQPHLVFLRSDPDFGKLLGLEIFDETEQSARKSLYFSPETFAAMDVSNRTAETVEDALAISLDESRTVDVDRIGQLLGVDAAEARQRLGQLVFDDPSTGQLVTAESYLSGDVRAKQQAAVQALESDSRYTVNVRALAEVVPEWVPISRIDVKPGVKYVTAGQYERFVSETFGAAAEIRENPDGSGWDVEKISKSRLSARVRFEYGTERANPSWILGRMMNNKPVTVHKTVTVDGKDRRVPDQKATTAARQKAAVIAAAFSAWVTDDPERVTAIEQQFNEALNSYVEPDYSAAGDRLQLRGLSPDRVPHAYQREAVARILGEPSVLLNHVVGAGKTGSMIMGAMELRRSGVANKPWMVVPNHLVEQITREFSQWYPAANTLMIPTGISPAQRNKYVAVSAANDWDAVICPQSVFSKIKVSDSKIRRWVQEDIDEMQQARQETSSEMGAKAIAGAIKRAEKRLERIGAGKDVGARLEETGCDYLFVDEAHEYKNLARQSEYRELSASGSDMATDLDFALRSLRESKAARAGTEADAPAVVTFATGTPVSNSLVEMWVMGHYLRPDLMERYGMPTIDGFGTGFTKASESVEVKPSGVGFRITNRVASFTNVEALMRLSSVYTSTVTRSEIPGGVPEKAAGKLIGHDRPASPAVAEKMAELVERAENPSESDQLLAVLVEARKVALDPRLADVEPDEDGGRARQVAEQILRIEAENAEKTYLSSTGETSERRGGLQLAFCDLGTPTGEGFNMYQGVKEELVAGGMDASKIAFIHDAETDQERTDLFSAAKDGRVKVLIGSTQKMGTGMNVQDRVTAIHHVDIPWRPSDLEQREGRAFRQGNQNETVEVHNYVTAGTFDAYMWQTINRKSLFLDQLRSGTATGEVEDIGGLSMSSQEMIAAGAGDPRVGDWMRMNTRIIELENASRAELGQRHSLEKALHAGRDQLDRLTGQLQMLQQAAPAAPVGEFRMLIGRQVFDNRARAGDRMIHGLEQMAIRFRQDPTATFGLAKLGGLTAVVGYEPSHRQEKLRISFDAVPGLNESVALADLLDGSVSGTGLATRIWNRAREVSDAAAATERMIATVREEVEGLEVAGESQSSMFSGQEELDRLQIDRDVLGAELGLDVEDDDEASDEMLTETEMRSVFHAEAVDLMRSREGDVINISKAAGGLSPGLHTVQVDEDGKPHAIPEGSAGEAQPLTYAHDGDLVARRRDALTPFEQELLESGEDDLVCDRATLVRAAETGETITVVGTPTVTDGGQETETATEGVFTGRLMETVTEGAIRTRVELARTEGAHVRVDLPYKGMGPVAIRRGVRDVQAEAEQALQAEAAREADRAKTGAGRMMPGDVFVSGDETVAEPGWIVEPGGKYFMDPATEDSKTRYVPRAEAVLQPGRDLEAEEIERVFGGALTNIAVGDLRPGDVVNGRKLDAKSGPNENVQVVGKDGYDMVTVAYRPLSEPAWGTVQEVRRRDSTKVGGLISRRHGALDHVEKAHAVVDGQTSRVKDLSEEHQGQWILVPGRPVDEPEGKKRWYSGKLKGFDHEVESNRSVSSYARHVGPRYDSVLEVETVPGEIDEVRVAAPASVAAFVLDGEWPEAGIDFCGTTITEDVAAEAESPSGQNVDEAGIVELAGFEISQELAGAVAGAAEETVVDQERPARDDAGEHVEAETVDETLEPGIDAAKVGSNEAGLEEAEADGEAAREPTVPDGTVEQAVTDVGREQARTLVAAQVRPGDRVQFGEDAEFREVIDVQALAARRMRMLTLGAEGPATGTKIGANRQVNVVPYTTSEKETMSARTRTLGQLRAGDVVSELASAGGRAAEVLDVVHLDDVVELELLNESDNRAFHRGWSTESAPVRMPACNKDAVGIRGPETVVVASDLSRGALIRTRATDPALVVGAETTDGSTQIEFQLLGSTNGQVQTITKEANEPLVIHQQRHVLDTGDSAGSSSARDGSAEALIRPQDERGPEGPGIG